jgi:transposase
MVVIGSDVHKRTHTFVAVDQAGRKLGEITVRAPPKGHDKAIGWAQERFDGELVRPDRRPGGGPGRAA